MDVGQTKQSDGVGQPICEKQHDMGIRSSMTLNPNTRGCNCVFVVNLFWTGGSMSSCSDNRAQKLLKVFCEALARVQTCQIQQPRKTD